MIPTTRELWCIDPSRFPINVSAGDRAASAAGAYTRNRTAIVPIVGAMSREGDWGASTDAVRAAINQYAGSDQIDGILLAINSPGGKFAGTDELTAAISNAAQLKSVHAHITDVGASAAYWAAAATNRITATRTSMVGSLGTFSVAYDMSRAADAAGISVRLYSTGTYKGAGAPGVAVTKEHDAYFQSIIDRANGFFQSGVMAGRGSKIGDLKALWDGRAHFAAQAQQLGLIDAVGTLSDAVAALEAAARPPVAGQTSADASAASPDSPPWEATPAGKRVSLSDARAVAVAEWSTDKGGCRAAFGNEQAYVGYREAVLIGAYVPPASRSKSDATKIGGALAAAGRR